GVPADKITVLRNGVDIDLFKPEDRRAAKADLGLPGGPTVAMVGNLVPEKDHALAMRAVARLPDCHHATVGDGPARHAVQSLALADEIARLLRAPAAAETVRAHARQFDWHSNSRAQFDLLGRVARAEPAGIGCHASATAR